MNSGLGTRVSLVWVLLEEVKSETKARRRGDLDPKDPKLPVSLSNGSDTGTCSPDPPPFTPALQQDLLPVQLFEEAAWTHVDVCGAQGINEALMRGPPVRAFVHSWIHFLFPLFRRLLVAKVTWNALTTQGPREQITAWRLLRSTRSLGDPRGVCVRTTYDRSLGVLVPTVPSALQRGAVLYSSRANLDATLTSSVQVHFRYSFTSSFQQNREAGGLEKDVTEQDRSKMVVQVVKQFIWSLTLS
ncbi:hypothetical protein H920_14563 [Fukomys damarensis]|uniref:Uncharacterized protein n=1 Tax=Fukomys damarensis TaxID=885580 RepID=A0A091CWG2_FUKDA|nr:hypothetical protein H920_14563 [Fukomys damarensis]